MTPFAWMLKPFAASALIAAGLSVALAEAPSMIGTWEIIEAMPGPWTPQDQRAALTAEGKNMVGLVITFEPHQVKSRNRAFTCRRVVYEANALEADALFQGNLPEPNPTAAALRLGFKRGDVPGVDVKCVNALYTFHFRDPDTAMFNLNSVIYTLKRQP